MYDMLAADVTSQHMEKKIHLSEALGTTQLFLWYFFFFGPFLFSEIRWNDSSERKHTFMRVFWGSSKNLFLFFFFLPAVNGYRKAFMPTKKYLGFIHIGIVMNKGSFYLDIQYFFKTAKLRLWSQMLVYQILQ